MFIHMVQLYILSLLLVIIIKLVDFSVIKYRLGYIYTYKGVEYEKIFNRTIDACYACTYFRI